MLHVRDAFSSSPSTSLLRITASGDSSWQAGGPRVSAMSDDVPRCGVVQDDKDAMVSVRVSALKSALESHTLIPVKFQRVALSSSITGQERFRELTDANEMIALSATEAEAATIVIGTDLHGGACVCFECCGAKIECTDRCNVCEWEVCCLKCKLC